MDAKFITASEVSRQRWPDMGDLGVISQSAGTNELVFADLFFAPGDGFNFHEHPNQTEVLYLMAGSLEAWIEEEKRTIQAGDTLFLPAGTVHACFNVSAAEARMFVILAPAIASEELGFELVDRSGEAPWNALR